MLFLFFLSVVFICFCDNVGIVVCFLDLLIGGFVLWYLFVLLFIFLDFVMWLICVFGWLCVFFWDWDICLVLFWWGLEWCWGVCVFCGGSFFFDFVWVFVWWWCCCLCFLFLFLLDFCLNCIDCGGEFEEGCLILVLFCFVWEVGFGGGVLMFCWEFDGRNWLEVLGDCGFDVCGLILFVLLYILGWVFCCCFNVCDFWWDEIKCFFI